MAVGTSLSPNESSHKPVQAQYSLSVGRKEAAVGHNPLVLLYPRGLDSLASHLPWHWQNSYQICQKRIPINDNLVLNHVTWYEIQGAWIRRVHCAMQFPWGYFALLPYTAVLLIYGVHSLLTHKTNLYLHTHTHTHGGKSSWCTLLTQWGCTLQERHSWCNWSASRSSLQLCRGWEWQA